METPGSTEHHIQLLQSRISSSKHYRAIIIPTRPTIPTAAPETAVGIAPPAAEVAELKAPLPPLEIVDTTPPPPLLTLLTMLDPPDTIVVRTPPAPLVMVDATPPAPLVIFVATLPPPTTTVEKTDVTPETTSVVKVE
jgi:hypothetical protein